MRQFVNKIIVGNCLDVLTDMQASSVDLVITSPPYFQQRDYGNKNLGIGSEKTEQAYLDNLLAIFRQCVRVTKPTGAIVFNVGDKYIDGSLRLIPYQFALRATAETGVKLINDLTWIKLNPTPRQEKRKLIQSTEPFFIFTKSKKYTFNLDNYLKHLDDLNGARSRKPSNRLGKKYYDLIAKSDLTSEEKACARQALKQAILSVHEGEIAGFRMKIRGVHKLAYGGQAGGRNDQINNNGFTVIKITGNRLKRDTIESPVEITKDNKHPAVYPLYIIQELVKLLSEPSDLVLDPFCGSGTTPLAAKILGRCYIGIEINCEYAELSRERLQQGYQQELFV